MRQAQRASRAEPSLSPPSTTWTSSPSDPMAMDWTSRLARGDFAAVIEEYVAAYQPVTFPEITRLVAPHIPVQGECGLQVGDDENCVLYGDLSSDLAEILHQMLADRRLVARPCVTLFYDTAEPLRRLPLLMDVPDRALASPHWLPCALHTVLPATVKPVQRPAEVN